MKGDAGRVSSINFRGVRIEKASESVSVGIRGVFAVDIPRMVYCTLMAVPINDLGWGVYGRKRAAIGIYNYLWSAMQTISQRGEKHAARRRSHQAI